MEFLDTRLSVHHIGGRNGSRAFPVLKDFEQDVVNVLYEADADCLEHIKEQTQNLTSELHILPYCLAESCKSTFIHINYDPFTSSLYKANPEYGSYYSRKKDFDYIISEATRVMEERPIETVTIDHIFQSKKINVPPPDFLSIDTQGSEYEVLLGAKEALKSSIVALGLEVEFHPIYKGQKLFGDIVKLLSDLGFNFVRFLNIHELSPFRASLGHRGDGFHTYSDALFFRRLNNIGNNYDELDKFIMLRKLAFIAIVYNQFEFGLECLNHSNKFVGNLSTIKKEKTLYLRFLSELERLIEKKPKIFPITFASKYSSFEASKSRFECTKVNRTTTRDRSGSASRIKQIAAKIPILYLILKQIKRIVKTFYKILIKIVKSIKLLLPVYSDVERFLTKYGLKTQANNLKRNRVND